MVLSEELCMLFLVDKVKEIVIEWSCSLGRYKRNIFRILMEKQSPFGRLGRMGEDNSNTDLKGSRLRQF